MKRHFPKSLWQPQENNSSSTPDVIVSSDSGANTNASLNPPTPRVDFPSLSDIQFGSSADPTESTGVFRNSRSLFDIPAASSVTTQQDLIEKQATDMFSALQQEVGVLMQSTAAGQASPFVRGVTGQQVLILVDGIRLNNSIFRFGPNQYFNTIDAGVVDHIEVSRGQGSVLWGSDAIGGAINVVTRSADMQYASTQGDYFGHEFTQTYNTAKFISLHSLKRGRCFWKNKLLCRGQFFECSRPGHRVWFR